MTSLGLDSSIYQLWEKMAMKGMALIGS